MNRCVHCGTLKHENRECEVFVCVKYREAVAKIERLCSRGIEDMKHEIKELEAKLAEAEDVAEVCIETFYKILTEYDIPPGTGVDSRSYPDVLIECMTSKIYAADFLAKQQAKESN